MKDGTAQQVDHGPTPAEAPCAERGAEGLDQGAWRRKATAVGKAARSTGRALGTLYRLGKSNSHFLQPALNGVIGDKLAAAGDPLAIQMSFRQGGRDVPVHALRLGSRLRGSGRNLVVMVHGHCADEIPFWKNGTDNPGYGKLLEEVLGVTVLCVRYNTGLHVSQNGRSLSALLQSVVAAHGDQIRRLVLVGASMGGLVVRSATHYGDLPGLGADGGEVAVESPGAAPASLPWTAKLETVVLIGAPVMGSYVEQLADLSTRILGTIVSFHTRAIARIVDERSNGIKDLRTGSMVDEDWKDVPHHASDSVGGIDRPLWSRTPVPLRPGVAYHVLVGTLPADQACAVSAVVGDGLVGRKSASGESFFGEDDPISGGGTHHVFAGLSHWATVTSPEVGERLVDIVRQRLASA